ncbi:BNR-4 repeat-containing protein [Pelagicoccus enzymogenes]|uniref:BNR-4 repeat-containing protein n=1 Tax=Pelagicoccus enzymogenes TaxID=2773457 RepID=UPI00280E28DE|nr:BNR-4 repeat-containing protein [Pelagicoccus enzymogenes]MDQ8198644.1 BNR-4 repeat-containing protein [Pelagicoccus enzymogenes]
MTEKEYLAQREALIENESTHDRALPALLKLMEEEDTFSREFWHFKIDQYLYGQYPDFQRIYDAYREGKAFTDIYDLDLESTLTTTPDVSDNLPLPEIPDGHFSDNLPNNTHTGSTLFVDGKVYVSYEGHLTDPYIASFDVENHVWDGPYKAGHSTLSKNGRKIDSHGRPALQVNGDGHFHIVFGGHGGEWEDGLNPMSFDTPHAGGRMLHVATEKPGDISSWIQKDDISPFASYTKIMKMGNGDIYFFTRAGTHKSPWIYYKMENGSQTFGEPVKITWPTISEGDPVDVDTFYINPKKVSDTEILITFLWHICNFREIHNKVHYSRINTYYMKLDTSDDTFYNVEGKKLEVPITKKIADTYALAYDSEATGETSFSTEPLPDQDGKPSAAYIALGQGYREWRMVQYQDAEWVHSLPMPGTESRTLIDENGKPVKRIFDLERIESKDKSKTAAVLYTDDNGNAAFGIASTSSELGTVGQDWKVDKVFASVPKSRMEFQAVRNDDGKAEAIILNIRKGKAQRLYLWHDGQFWPTNK